ncbi:hypothetical protein [Curtobacterium sp. PhB136]|uniref:hypothetical protein n=1 Tax=Curtobacterium sp. PhB136 TaxID=2485181 RepID=UPI001045F9AA|nr:hypothetical protein [Curtobacterium sp. PhB136]TCK58229.1 hypothetical protein EDF27_3838 [Curtobacterium sp. PhB136]
MSARQPGRLTLRLEDLSPETVAVLRLAQAGEDIGLSRSGRPIGVLRFEVRSDAAPQSGDGPGGAGWPDFTANVGCEGRTGVAAEPDQPEPTDGTRQVRRTDRHDGPPRSADVTVVAVAMELSDTARARLSDELGPGYVVLDLGSAPSTTDVVLTPATSPQLLGHLRQDFPAAHVVIAEIDDDELGVRHVGPVTRLLEAGASAYLPPRPIAQIASGLSAHLAEVRARALSSAERSGPALPSRDGAESPEAHHDGIESPEA